jgi:dTMP kinase
MNGKFISFEGGEGSGKSTQLQLLAAAFEKSGLPFISTREPGGSSGAERIRSLLVSGKTDAWDALTETLLFNAARADHINHVIRPALAEGKIVICDRFFDSTLVYQGIGKNLGEEYIKNLHRIIFGNFMPDLTIMLDIAPEDGLKRASARADNENRFEQLDIEFHKKIRAGFLSIATREPERCMVFDATQEVEILHKQIVGTINTHCGISL